MRTPHEQLETATKSAVLFAGPERAILRVVGKDRVSWLNGLLTCDVASLKSGEGAYGLLVDKKGKITSDLYIAIFDDDVRVAVPRHTKDQVFDVLDHHLIMEDAELSWVEEALFIAHGPSATTLRETLPNKSAQLDLTGLGGALWFVDNTESFLADAAKELTAVSGALGDEAGWDAIRVHRGIPKFDVDFDRSNYPQEASLSKAAVSFSKGCYLGQEVVFMLEKRGHPKQKLVLLEISGPPPTRGANVCSANKEDVGKITSSAARAFNDSTSLAMVKWASAADGTKLLVNGADAVVVPIPR